MNFTLRDTKYKWRTTVSLLGCVTCKETELPSVYLTPMAEAAYVKHRVPELCRHFLRGRCRFGSACRFSHQREDVALPFGHRQYVQSQVGPCRPWTTQALPRAKEQVSFLTCNA